jgi:Regulator of ribonuclease activity B
MGNTTTLQMLSTLYVILSFLMFTRNDNTFFTKEIYDTEIGLEVNSDVLERIYSSHVTAETSLPIEFFYVSDQEEKLKRLGLHLLEEFPQYTDLKVQPFNGNYELLGVTHPIKMELTTVNKWNQEMWDIGYLFDCKLDGWQVGAYN